MGPFAKAVYEETNRWRRRPEDTFETWRHRFGTISGEGPLPANAVEDSGWPFFDVTEFMLSSMFSMVHIQNLHEQYNGRMIYVHLNNATYLVFEDADDAVKEKLALPNLENDDE